jgi:ribosomal protein S27E
MTENVIHLSFRSPHVEDGERAMLSCKNCQNKTYTLVHDKPAGFPMMQCAGCGAHIGRMGWAHDDDTALDGGAA